MGQITAKGNKQVQNKLAKLAKGIGNKRPVLKRIGVALVKQVNEHFQKQGNEQGGWAPTVRGGQILRDTGNLAGSFVFEVKDDSVQVGSPVDYSEWHEYGVPERNLPVRRMLPLPKTATRIAEEIIKKYIKELTKK